MDNDGGLRKVSLRFGFGGLGCILASEGQMSFGFDLDGFMKCEYIQVL